MVKYYLDKQYRDNMYNDTFYSYEAGAYDDMYFKTTEEAQKYALDNQYRLEENEKLIICEFDFQQKIKLLLDNGSITSRESLIDFAKEKIDNDDLFLAIHILQAIQENDTEYYIYDYCMGTLETPSSIESENDIEYLIQDIMEG